MENAQSYHGTSFESFEDAVMNAGVPGSNIPESYAVSLGYSPPAGVVGRPQFHATLHPRVSLEQAGEAPVG